ncbi:MFS transporter [Streptomyces sp. NPDC093094]|uniref:MFS transporter n=1 Tax=Streptomyces sp. NPDC093094 TaxID=3366026 RepID=UPI0037F5EACF
MLIYVVRFTSWCSWGVLYPFLAVWLLREDVLDETAVGMVAGAAVIANRVGSLLFAPLVHRADKRTVVIASQLAVVVFSCALWLLGGAAAGSVLPWLAFAALFGLANSVATLAQVTFIAVQFPPGETRRAFSHENVALNIGAGVGPVLSSLALARTPDGYALAPVPFAVLSAVLAAFLPRDRPRTAEDEEPAAGDAPAPRVLPVFLAMNFLTLLAYAQFYSVFPTEAEPALGSTAIGLLFAFSSAVIVVSQVPLTRLVARFGERTQAAAANLATAAGIALLLRADTGPGPALAAVLLLTLGEMVYGPLYQAVAVRLMPGRPTYAMGVVTFVWGLAESLAGAVGLVLVGAGLGSAAFLGAAAGCVAVAGLAAVAPGVWEGRREAPQEVTRS